ncbi:MFS transporter [Krasilnikoviella flava]|uniref:Drug resistance transporter, EmrB/QacA subfamily n=1 Tax=Krasilnikoviella flava TaxID=526729 RepID=A0A1T5KSE4_9MICO|nr:MFS transporter [Krasilnikoviella flava]SKC66692.1 drug resistance transporter, EmrB/QacA subfamily [Krasilnikoviella flava]
MTSPEKPATAKTAQDRSAAPDPRRWRVLALLGVAQLMLIVDVTVVAIALPDMGADLGLDRAGLTWVASVYALVFGGLMLLGGKAADVVGPRRVVLAGLGLFTVASLLAGFAGSAEQLLAARALQGVGAAAMSPAALSVVVRTFAGAELPRALGVWSALGGAGAAVGVLLGGLLTSGPGWPWVFWVNVPVGVVLLLTLVRTVRPWPGSGGRLDLLGAALATLATAAVVYGLVAAGDHGWLGAQTLVALLVGVAGYVLLALRLRSAAAPLLDPAMLVRRPVARGLALILVATALMISVFFLGSFTLQQLHGFSPLDTGLCFLPVAVGTMLGANLAGRALPRWGVRAISVVGLLVAAAGLAAAAGIFSMTVLVVGITVAGFGVGSVFVAASGSLFSAVAPQEAGVASGALSTFHEFGAATGVSAVSSVAAAALLDPSFETFAAGYWFAAAVALVAGLASLAPARAAR